MTAAAPATLPRFLPWLLLPALTLPLQPFWLDFEQVRRSLLWLLLGALLLWRPVLTAATTTWNWLLGFVFLACATTAASANVFAGFAAGERLLWYLALGLLLRLPIGNRSTWLWPLATTLLLVAAFGLLQRFGLAELQGYGTPHEPVSTLGNLNVAAELVSIAMVGVSALTTSWRPLAALALFTAATYLAVNGSRSAWLILGAGHLWLLLAPPTTRRGGATALSLVAAGAACGFAIGPASTETPTPVTASPAPARSVSTLQVRLEIARGCVDLLAEKPFLGQGLGQFPIQYPRVRRQEEIELSTFGRQFAALPRTAHNDWLEIAVETGLPALLVLLIGLAHLLRAPRSERQHLAPLVALLAGMLVRAPLGNAPAVAIALLLAAPPGTTTRRRPVLLRIVGLILLAVSLPALLANTAFAAFQQFQATNPPGTKAPAAAMQGLVSASEWAPFDFRYRQLLAQVLLGERNLDGAQLVAARAAALSPHDPTLLLLLAEIAAQKNDLATAERLGRHALEIDPGHPEVRLLLATIGARTGRAEAAAKVLLERPHARLRERLPEHFSALATLAERHGDAPSAARLRAEQQFAALVPWLGRDDADSLRHARTQVPIVLQAFGDAGLRHRDARWRIAAALHALDLAQPAIADQLGASLPADLVFPPWQRPLLTGHLPRLLERPNWRAWLERTAD
ncbi:MAG: O-antigen ligase family protein [Planctomycetes bacterium]|nr:O-antigen ligase family protein [Planctomycetota bacterium]